MSRYFQHFRRSDLPGAWILFFVPGIMLLINTWAGLTAPLVMYLLLLLCVKEEEKYLECNFGSEYLAYKKNTPAVMPVGWLKLKD